MCVSVYVYVCVRGGRRGEEKEEVSEGGREVGKMGGCGGIEKTWSELGKLGVRSIEIKNKIKKGVTKMF